MPYTLRNLCTDALIEIGVVGADDNAPDDAEIRTALRYALLMSDAQSADRYNLYTTVRAVYTLVPGQLLYTIAPSGADFVGGRPMWVDDVRVRPAGTDTDLSMHRYSRKEWDAEVLKTLTNEYPYKWLYEYSTDVLGMFTFWPIPTTAAKVIIRQPILLTVTPDLDTELGFPPGLKDGWHYSLAKRLYRPMWHQDPPPGLVEDARMAMEVYRRNNDEGPPPARSDFAPSGGRYNMFTNHTQEG